MPVVSLDTLPLLKWMQSYRHCRARGLLIVLFVITLIPFFFLILINILIHDEPKNFSCSIYTVILDLIIIINKRRIDIKFDVFVSLQS